MKEHEGHEVNEKKKLSAVAQMPCFDREKTFLSMCVTWLYLAS